MLLDEELLDTVIWSAPAPQGRTEFHRLGVCEVVLCHVGDGERRKWEKRTALYRPIEQNDGTNVLLCPKRFANTQ
jgi:hypothetical protein